MHKELITLESIILIGVTARTSYKNEINPETGKIGPIIHSYWGNQTANQFKDRMNPGVTYAVYTDYESDEYGEYTYFLGEAVKSIQNQNMAVFESLIIPAGRYQKLTTNPGKMPDVVINAWKEIWTMTPADLSGKRSYKADFEVYDTRASDLNNAVLDIYIGIE